LLATFAARAASSSICLPSRGCRLSHSVEVAFERIHVSGPKPPERRQPGVQFLQRRRGEAVQSALGIHLRLHEAGVTQYPEVLRDRRLRHAELTLDLTDRLL